MEHFSISFFFFHTYIKLYKIPPFLEKWLYFLKTVFLHNIKFLGAFYQSDLLLKLCHIYLSLMK